MHPQAHRLRLRGPTGARDEFQLAATAQNLRKLAKLIPAPAQLCRYEAAGLVSDRPRPLTIAIAIIQKPTCSTESGKTGSSRSQRVAFRSAPRAAIR
jgi:hypothetical protein